jgi:hypothetical protein
MSNLWRIIKDGLKAFAFWFVASVAMIYFWGDVGKMLSYLLGFVFIIAFCVLRAGEILAWVLSLFRGSPGAPPAWKPPSSTPPTAPPPPVGPQYCPKCGAQWVAGAQRCANCG